MNSVFAHISSRAMADRVLAAMERVIFVAPGISQAMAGAVLEPGKRIGLDRVHVVVDIDERAARLGYGEFDAVTLLSEAGVRVRQEPGMRLSVLLVDADGVAFFTPPMLVEAQDQDHVGVNALVLQPQQVVAIAAALVPEVVGGDRAALDALTGPNIQLGRRAVEPTDLVALGTALEANPPQKFDLARKVNVFNSFVEFVELRLTGLHIGRQTVQLPKGLGLALRDDATAKRLLTTFKLVSEDSRVAKEAKQIHHQLERLRDLYTRPLGGDLGSVILRSKRDKLLTEVAKLQDEIETFGAKVLEQLQRELETSRKKLVEGLLPAVKRAKPEELQAQVSGPITSDIARKYIDAQLQRVFPEPSELVSEMRLDCVFKGVTYESLKETDFQKRIRQAFPFEDWDKPFKEFEVIAAETQPSLPGIGKF